MGLIQGLTEFLPVSSSGHLALFKILFHINTDTGMLFDVLLHIATLAAICVVYYKDVIRLIQALIQVIVDAVYNLRVLVLRRKNPEMEYRRIVTSNFRKFIIMIIISTIPTGIIGFVGRDLVSAASEVLIVPGICLLITAVILFFSDRAKPGHKGPKRATYTDAFIIGIAQGVATLPGISRSGSTIAASVFLGFDRRFAVKYSFLMSIPAIIAAMILEVHDNAGAVITGAMARNYVIGMIIAAVVGYIAIKLMIRIVKQRKFTYFSIWCVIVGVISIIGYAAM